LPIFLVGDSWYERDVKKVKTSTISTTSTTTTKPPYLRKRKKKKKKKPRIFVSFQLQFIPSPVIIEMESEGVKFKIRKQTQVEFAPVINLYEIESCRELHIGSYNEYEFFSRTKEIQKDDEEIIVAFFMSNF